MNNSRNRIHRQNGLTLVELLVTLVLMLLVVLATVALFTVSSSSYKTVDAGQELQDNARFAMEVLGQAARSAGFQDRTGPTSAGVNLADTVFGPGTPVAWRLEGANNAQLTSSTSAIAFGTNNGVNQSDALVIRFFGTSSTANPAAADGSMIDCAGRAIPYPVGSADLGVSAFFVTLVNGEPELNCKSYNPATGNFSSTQIVRGVESFQVMYGLDTDGDDVPNRWVSADSAWTPFAASPNWNNVVAIRVGMVLRGARGSAQKTGGNLAITDAEKYYYPLGQDFTGNSTETGLKFADPNDGRLRRAFATTFMLRNSVR
ncbi:MAG: PilW family protein [Rhodoferax sp.]|nr:PilW family protein [Rhodoferax sp.]